MKREILCLMLGLVLASSASADPMPLDGTWVKLDESMDVLDYFTGSWDWTSAYPVEFTITDWAVVSDQFEVYDFGALVLTTPAVPDWPDLGAPSAFTAPPYELDPDAALASGVFSSGMMVFAPGAHLITIRSIHIPPQDSGASFPDSTVAFKAVQVVPAPGALLLSGMGAGLIGWLRRRRTL